jgi:hypothetical protein
MADTVSSVRRFILESPPGEWALKQLRELLIGSLRQGPIPQHVAFEMDGNRRYARSHRMETVEGHHRGFEALARIMEVCYKCGVKVVTVYAFSIENFNRPKYEVEGLMELAKSKLEQLTSYGDILDRYGARVRVLGQREMIRDDVLEVVDKASARTRHNNKSVHSPFNIPLLTPLQSGVEHLLPLHVQSRDHDRHQVHRPRLPLSPPAQSHALFAVSHQAKDTLATAGRTRTAAHDS